MEILRAAALCVATLCVAGVGAQYQVGVGIADMTGPPVEVNFMGYANLGQTGQGIHLRQFARSFLVSDGNKRVVYVSVDTGMTNTGLRMEVLSQLNQTYGDLYDESNVILSGTHTHSTPGGFLMHLLFDITILGFVKQTFQAYANGVVRSIKMAHESLQPGRLYYKEGRVTNANINRSPSSYLENPQSERDLYEDGDTDKKVAQLKFVATDGTLLGALNWFAVHATSMNNTNTLVSSDNVGYASVLLEAAINPPGTFPGKGKFVGAFASTNLGDVSPNIMGPKCEFSRVACDVVSSRCADMDEKCFAEGPGSNMYESTKIIAQRIQAEGLRLLQTPDDYEITGPISVVHQFVDMPNTRVPDYNPETGGFDEARQVQGCYPAMGYSFAAGTTDGPGAFNFSQGTTSGNPIWDSIRNLLAEPTQEDIACQAPKPILLATGRINFPYKWQPDIVSTQLAVIGNLVLAAVPGEFTTMSGRRMRGLLANTFASAGQEVKVVVAGLSNTYSDYIATYEEYQAQRYEAASTIFGPHTLAIHLYNFNQLAKAVIAGSAVAPGPTPEDFSKDLISLVTPVIFDVAPWGLAFGDCVLQPYDRYRSGQTVHVKFISGNPRNNLMTEGTYYTVEKYNDDTQSWDIVATDAHWETRFLWERTSLFLGTSRMNIFWEVTDETSVGQYRIQHFGYFRYILGSVKAYTGISNTFQVY